MKRRPNTVRGYARRPASREAGLRLLIVCEGSKTEPYYFELIGQFARTRNLHSKIYGKECGTDPLSVAEYLEERLVDDSGYDFAFCVIDRDSHNASKLSHAKALVRALDQKHENTQVRLIISDPSIEYWFILHFEYTRAGFVASGGRSRADCAGAHLRTHITDYTKTSKSDISACIKLTKTAINNSRKSLQDAVVTNEFNPSTTMHEFFELTALCDFPFQDLP